MNKYAFSAISIIKCRRQ